MATLLCLSLSALPSVADNVTLAWDANSETNVIGYRLHYGPTSGQYTNSITINSPLTSATVYNLTGGSEYFFAVTAFNESGLESDPSNEVSYLVPQAAPTLTIERTFLSTMVLTVKGKPGEEVIIQATRDLDAPIWEEAFRGIIPSSGEITFIEATNSSARRFYRAL